MSRLPPAAAALRRPGDALPRASIGVVPIVWNNADLTDLSPLVPAATVLDEVARLGYEGCQLGRGFPDGTELRDALAARGLRLAEVYAALPCGPDGPLPAAGAAGRERLAALHTAGGEVLVVALDGSPERDAVAGRAAAAEAPRLSEEGWRRLAALLDELAQEAQAAGHRLAFHNHTGTYVETAGELDRLVGSTSPGVGVCLDVGHLLVGGGDPVAALRRHGERVVHVHLKDVDREVLARLRGGALPGFTAAIAERLFTELGSGVLDLPGVVAELAARDYAGWLMVEQDTCWGPPSESAAIGRRVLAYVLRDAGRQPAAA
ncbi:MAG TPA: sugar phosphate isomerase/epimerase [Candidatus Limnocylindrales bacterium]|nr:sugar phosphate isomerase/epimerase [Candidatus Limnocylindrales bacterium]